MEKIIDGRVLAAGREELLKNKVTGMPRPPHIVSILVGDDPSSQLYTNMKQRKAEEMGIIFEVKHFLANTPFEKVVRMIDTLNYDNSVDGVMVQLPLPKEFLRDYPTERIIEVIDVEKDVDGLTGEGTVLPATVRGVFSILESEKVLGMEKRIVVVGGVHGMVGTSLVRVLKEKGEGVSGVSRSDQQLSEKTKVADVLISAVGKKNLITRDMVKPGAVVIDIGKDVDFENVREVASRITPPKGGVGPMTIISLMENAIEIARKGSSW